MSDPRIEAIYELSPQQLGMLLESCSSPETGIHLEQEIYTFEGTLDTVAFERAWRGILQRHSIYRTAFVWKDAAEPVQVVLRSVDLPLAQQDWRELTIDEQQKRLDDFLAADRRRGFKLAKAPLMRLTLFRTGETRYQLLLTQHHLLTDGWCWHILHQDFLHLYQTFARGEDAQLEPGPSYGDYVAWLKRQDPNQAESFWREILTGFREPTPLGVPEEPLPDQAVAERYVRQTGYLTAAETATLQTFARQHHLTLNTVVQGVWALLLGRYSGEQDLVFGTTVSGRPADLAGVESVIGLFVNILPFRVQIRPEEALGPFLAAIQTRHLELRSYEYCSAGQIHAWSEIPPVLPLFESVLVYQNYPKVQATPETEVLPLKMRFVRSTGATTRYALLLLVTGGSELRIHLVCDGRRLDSTQSARILKHLQGLLRSIAADPRQSLQALMASVPAGDIPRIRSLPVACQDVPTSQTWAPPSASQAMLARVWAEVLGVDRIGIRDNFFDLGGHSLLALRLFAQIKNMTGRDLPLATLLQAPTIEKLAEVLDREGWSPSWSCLVSIQPRGFRPPFFCVHGHGGNVVGFHNLARYLGPDQPFWGLQAMGLDGRQPGYSRMEDIAAHYLQEIRALQPRGPYYLGGYCFGGLVALEMAQQLQAEGETVALLALLDVVPPDYLAKVMVKNSVRLHLGRMKTLSPRARLQYVWMRAGKKIREGAAHLYGRVTSPLPRALREVEARHMRASREYHLRPYAGRVALLRAEKQPWMYRDWEMGWGRWVQGGLEIYEVPGSNGTFLEEPHVRVTAERLRHCLEAATLGSPSSVPDPEIQDRELKAGSAAGADPSGRAP